MISQKLTLRLLILSLILTVGCSVEDMKAVNRAKRNVIKAAKQHPDVKDVKILAIKKIKRPGDAEKFLKRRGWYYPIGRTQYGDIMVVARVYFRGEFFGTIMVYICDARGEIRR